MKGINLAENQYFFPISCENERSQILDNLQEIRLSLDFSLARV